MKTNVPERWATCREGLLPGVRVLVGIACLAAAGATLVLLCTPSPSQAQELAWGLTAIRGLKVGHFTLSERPTGCTVVLAEGGAVGGVDVRGGAPGTRETALLDPVSTVQEVHAVVLSGRERVWIGRCERSRPVSGRARHRIPGRTDQSTDRGSARSSMTCRSVATRASDPTRSVVIARRRKPTARPRPKATSAPAPAPRSGKCVAGPAP